MAIRVLLFKKRRRFWFPDPVRMLFLEGYFVLDKDLPRFGIKFVFDICSHDPWSDTGRATQDRPAWSRPSRRSHVFRKQEIIDGGNRLDFSVSLYNPNPRMHRSAEGLMAL